jgi:hypothetical protein
MAKAGHWRTSKTVRVTILCGMGHVSSSVILALLGSAAVVGAQRMVSIETLRGDIAAWGLIAFGIVYGTWGLRRALRRRSHHHAHAHADGTVHHHHHDHTGVHGHMHAPNARHRLTPWVLFTIFVLGPCEPLIPLLMYPAVKQSAMGFIYISTLFALVTIASMLAVVLLALLGMKPLGGMSMERWSHAIGGLAVLACGVAIKFFGL